MYMYMYVHDCVVGAKVGNYPLDFEEFALRDVCICMYVCMYVCLVMTHKSCNHTCINIRINHTIIHVYVCLHK